MNAKCSYTLNKNKTVLKYYLIKVKEFCFENMELWGKQQLRIGIQAVETVIPGQSLFIDFTFRDR